jgi:hypothetical protein
MVVKDKFGAETDLVCMLVANVMAVDVVNCGTFSI